MGHTYTKNIDRYVLKPAHPTGSRHSKLEFSRASHTDQESSKSWRKFDLASLSLDQRPLVPATTKSVIRKGSCIRCLHFSGNVCQQRVSSSLNLYSNVEWKSLPPVKSKVGFPWAGEVIYPQSEFLSKAGGKGKMWTFRIRKIRLQILAFLFPDLWFGVN